MNLVKLKGIVIKEVQYKDNDKIITILTDNLGKISCIAKGAKKSNSPILANSQYLVYSEFILYKRSSYYYVNSATVLNTFYKLRVDFDKLQIVFELTRILNTVTNENEDTSNILKLFLNTIYILQNYEKDVNFVVATFKIKLFALMGFAPRFDKCSICQNKLFENDVIHINYDYVTNTFVCNNCAQKFDKKRYIQLSKATAVAINYVVKADIKKVFSFKLANLTDYELFGQVYADTMSNGI